MTLLDLFSGIGGFSLAARWAGIETVQFVEIDPFCQKVLAKNFPGVPIHDDIKTFRAAPGSADIISGGFPCQDLSSCGKGAGIDAERSGLWKELHKQICMVRPRYAVIENVTDLLSGDNGRWFQRVLTDLAEGGFNAEWECIPASSLGAPHQRDRVFIVAYPREIGWLRVFTKTNLKVRRNLGNNKRADWFGSGEGAWADWQTKTRKEILHKPIISREDDGFSGWLDRLSSLGNAIVPQIAHEIFEAIKEVE